MTVAAQPASIVDVLGSTRLLPVVVVDDADDAATSAPRSSPVACTSPRSRSARPPRSRRCARWPRCPTCGRRRHGAHARPQVDAAVDAGARFIVSPGFAPAVVRRCQELGVPVLPGVATADRDHRRARRRPGDHEVLPGRACSAAPRCARAGRAVPRRCGSCPPAGSPPHTWPSTWPCRRCSPSAAPGWSPPTWSRRATGTEITEPGARRRAARGHGGRRADRVRTATSAATTWSRSARSCSASTRARAGCAPPAPSGSGRAAASTTWPAACAAASGCAPRWSPRSPTTRWAGCSRT